MTSIEPGYYEQDHYGIRLEHIYLVKPLASAHKMGNGLELRKFELLTLILFQMPMRHWVPPRCTFLEFSSTLILCSQFAI